MLRSFLFNTHLILFSCKTLHQVTSYLSTSSLHWVTLFSAADSSSIIFYFSAAAFDYLASDISPPFTLLSISLSSKFPMQIKPTVIAAQGFHISKASITLQFKNFSYICGQSPFIAAQGFSFYLSLGSLLCFKTSVLYGLQGKLYACSRLISLIK